MELQCHPLNYFLSVELGTLSTASPEIRLEIVAPTLRGSKELAPQGEGNQ